MANEEHLQIFLKGTDHWNKWRIENIHLVPDLSELGHGYELPQSDLRKVNFYRTNLRSSDLSGVNLEGALLREADLQYCDLMHANLRKAVLRQAKLTNAVLDGADLSKVEAEGADFSECRAYGAKFTAAKLEGAIFRRAELGVRAEGDSYSDGQFHIDTTQPTDFSGASLRRVDLRESTVGVGFHSDDYVIDDEGEICGVTYESADLTGADMSDVMLRPYDKLRFYIDFRKATLIGARLDRANITGARLWESQRSEWSIMGLDCHSASWDKEGCVIEYYDNGRFERAFATTHQIVLEHPGGIEPINVAMLPLIVEELSAKFPRCQIAINSMSDLGSRAAITISVLDRDQKADEKFESEFLELKATMNSIQEALATEQNLRKQAELLLSYHQDTILPKIMEAAMKAGKTVNIGTVSGNYVDAERARYVEISRNSTVEQVTLVQLGQLARYIDEHSGQLKQNLTDQQWQEVEASKSVLEAQVKSSAPDKNILKEALSSVRKVAESASGSLLASGIRMIIGF